MKGRDKFMEVLTMNKKIMFTRIMNIVSMILAWVIIAGYVYDGLSDYTIQGRVLFVWMVYLAIHFTRNVIGYFKSAMIVVNKDRNFVTYNLIK